MCRISKHKQKEKTGEFHAHVMRSKRIFGSSAKMRRNLLLDPSQCKWGIVVCPRDRTGVTFIYLHCLKYVVLLRYDLRILSVPIVVPIVAATMRVG